ncbi:hypothetical protein J3458_008850 [Metarhizium acridum]|uniref:uncharacterized protein n=1 Tax=Metarhizium acridum TaxID=92637 RepID=UPI001C6B792E|nr:hypothetical protein J3458_008850 [Metarhizium acridum]
MHQLMATAALWHRVVADCLDQFWVGVGSSTRAPAVPHVHLLTWANQSTGEARQQPASTSYTIDVRSTHSCAQPQLATSYTGWRDPARSRTKTQKDQDGVRLPPAPISPIVYRFSLLRGSAKEILHGILSMPHMQRHLQG